MPETISTKSLKRMLLGIFISIIGFGIHISEKLNLISDILVNEHTYMESGAYIFDSIALFALGIGFIIFCWGYLTK